MWLPYVVVHYFRFDKLCKLYEHEKFEEDCVVADLVVQIVVEFVVDLVVQVVVGFAEFVRFVVVLVAVRFAQFVVVFLFVVLFFV